MFTSSSRALDSALLQFTSQEAVSWVDAVAFGRGLAEGTFRREWTWLAFVDDTPVARGVWWGPVGSVHPVALRCLIVDSTLPHPKVWGAALVRSAHRAFAEAGAMLAPDLVVDVAASRRDHPEAERALAWRRLAAREAGLPVESATEVSAVDGSVVRRSTFSARPLAVSRPAVLAGVGR